MSDIVWAADLVHVYPDGTRLEYAGEPFRVAPGERVALIGPNGSGKSTLLLHLIGLLQPNSGEVRVLGHDPAREFERVREQVGVLLQNPAEQILMPTVRDDIAFAARNAGMSNAEIERRIERIAAEFEIEPLLDRIPHYLSGGEQIRVALAGALILDPVLLILDEPFEGLDAIMKVHLIQLINRLCNERGLAVVLTTHELNLVPYVADTVYLLERGGHVIGRGQPAEILGRPELLCKEGHPLEPPILSQLFAELRARGIYLPVTLKVEEAAAVLANAIPPLVRSSGEPKH